MPTKMSFTFLTPAEEKKLISVISDIRDKALVRMFLDTGLFMSELQHLTFADLDLETGLMKVSGTKKRTVPLNPELVILLKEYLQTRADCEIQALFITGRGKPAQLSHRAIDKMLTKYKLKANLAKKVNTLVLRNTFAVKLCLAAVTFEKLTAILGVTNGETIERYVRAAKEIKETDLIGTVDMLDKRSPAKKVMDKIFSPPEVFIPKQKVATPNDNQLGLATIIGRDKIIQDIKQDLARGQSVLLVGAYGAGKTAIIKSIVPEYTEESANSMKTVLINLAKKFTDKLYSKISVNELLEIIKSQPGIIIPFDNVDIARKDNLDVVLRALPNYAFLLTAEKITAKMQRIQQQVNTYYLNKLTDEDIKQIINNWLTKIPIAENQKEILYNKILLLANGIPGTAVHLLEKLTRQPRVSENIIRELYLDHSDDNRDWSNLLILGFSAIIALRYISRGTGDTELYILSGVVYAFFLALKTLGRGRSK